MPINVLSYAPLYKTKSDEICTSIEEVKEYLESLEWKQGEEYYKKLLEAIQMISQLKKKEVAEKSSEGFVKGGSKLKAIEDQISCLDKYQSKAVIETVEGVQRIRGSGRIGEKQLFWH